MANSNFGVLFLKRLLVLAKVAFSFLSRDRVQMEDGYVVRLTGPVKFRMFLETMGGAFIKFGQTLALYQEILPAGYAEELIRIKNKAIELPFRTMNEAFFRETGRWMEDLFAELDKKPITSTVTAQVYKGELHDGAVVTVKIQRPYVKEIFEADYGVISFMLHLLSLFGLLPAGKVDEIIASTVSWTRKSLNFVSEAKNADILFKHNLRHSSSIIPKQYLEYCTPKVLTQEFIFDSVSLEDVIKYKKEKAELVGEEFDPIGVVECFINDELREYFIEGFFHAMPHAANLVFTQNYATVHLDFGIVGSAGGKRVTLLKMLKALSQKDADGFCAHVFEFSDKLLQNEMENYLKADVSKRMQEEKILEKIKDLIFEDFKKDVSQNLNEWFALLENENTETKLKSAAYNFAKIYKKMSVYGINFPREADLFLRALFLLDTIGLMTSNQYNFVDAMRDFFGVHPAESLERDIVNGECAKEIGSKLISLTELDWEFFKESSASEKERIMAARETISELISYYGEKYEEVGSMINKLK